jgi:hypothetical protein
VTWNEYKSEEFDLDENEDEDSIARDPERVEVRTSFVRSNDLLQILELDIVLFNSFFTNKIKTSITRQLLQRKISGFVK